MDFRDTIINSVGHYLVGPENACGNPGEAVTNPEDITCPGCQRLAPPSMNPYLILNWKRFIRNYAPSVTSYEKKAAGIREYTEADRAAINAGVAKYITALQNAVFCLLLLLANCGKSIDPPAAKPVETNDKVWAKDWSVYVSTHAEAYNRVFIVSVDLTSAVTTARIPVPAGHTQAELRYWGEPPSNPKILRIEKN